MVIRMMRTCSRLSVAIRRKSTATSSARGLCRICFADRSKSDATRSRAGERAGPIPLSFSARSKRRHPALRRTVRTPAPPNASPKLSSAPEMHLARLEHGDRAVGQADAESAAGSMPAPVPSPRAQRTGRSSNASQARSASSVVAAGSAARTSSATSSALSAGSIASGSAASVAARSRSSGGRSSSRTATLMPIPMTAQPSPGRPSTRMPASLRPASRTSLGHLIVTGSAESCPATSATARPARSGSSGSGPRITSDAISARPGGADQVRPCRPRPAVCSRAVTSVPCGAPPAASSRACVFVDSVRRRWTRGVPSVMRARSGRSRRDAGRAASPRRRC